MRKKEPNLATDLRVKRVYDAAAPDDGARILVDRLWPRGLNKTSAALTFWHKDIAPSTGLRKWFAHDPTRWTEFRKRYRMELHSNTQAVDRLGDYLKDGPVTLLYAAHDTTHNHALVLADYLRDHIESRNGRHSA